MPTTFTPAQLRFRCQTSKRYGQEYTRGWRMGAQGARPLTLSKEPVAFRLGYQDACESARVRPWRKDR